MVKPRVFADFHNADQFGRLRLNCAGTLRDLADQGVRLHEGLTLLLYSEDLLVEGCVHHSADEGLWVVVLDWEAIERRSS